MYPGVLQEAHGLRATLTPELTGAAGRSLSGDRYQLGIWHNLNHTGMMGKTLSSILISHWRVCSDIHPTVGPLAKLDFEPRVPQLILLSKFSIG